MTVKFLAREHNTMSPTRARLGVANSPSKTLGLPKFYSNFKGFAVRILGLCMSFTASFFVRKCLAVSFYFFNFITATFNFRKSGNPNIS